MRGNSVYFPDRVVPMLPERISNDLCSLRPNEDRAALAVRMVIGADGRKRSHTFHRVLMRSAAKLHYAQAQDAADGRTDETTGALLDRVIEPLYAAYAAVKRERAERQPLDLDLPERKILLKPDGTVDRVDHAAAARRAPADRGVHDPRQRRGGRDAGARARAADLSRARRALAGEDRGAARISRHARHSSGQGPGDAARRLQQDPGARAAAPSTSRLVNEVVLRTPGAGRIRGRELRPFRAEPAPLCAFHLADPPLRRPGGAPRAHPRAEFRLRRPAGQHGHQDARRDRGAHLGGRAARHEGRARDRRPADRAFPRRPHRRDASKAASAASRAPACS